MRKTHGYDPERAIEAWLRRRCRLPLTMDQVALTASIQLGMLAPLSRQSADIHLRQAMMKLRVAMRRTDFGDGLGHFMKTR